MKNLVNLIKYSPQEVGEEILDKIKGEEPLYHTLKYSDIKNLIVDANKILDLTGKNMIYIKIKGIEHPDMEKSAEKTIELIKNGFMPALIEDYQDESSLNTLDELIEYFVERISLEAIEYWGHGFRSRLTYTFSSLAEDGSVYIYANIRGWKQFAMETAISFPLIMYDKSLVYSSLRPKTDMLIFKQPNFASYKKKKKINDWEYVLDDNKHGVPVTRYSRGMSRGLFYSAEGEDEGFCGTFYYYEPESTTFLTYKTAKVYRNKYEAMIDLDPKSAEYFLPKNTNSAKYIWYTNPKLLPEDLKFTPIEYFKFFYKDEEPYDEEEGRDNKYWEEIGNKKRYVGKDIAYAEEDDFDQPLCKAAAKKGIDVIILTHMIGSKQIVTEVLDTRERIKSFSSICYLR